MTSGASNPPPLPPPRVPDHELLRRIGRGAYGEVWLARSVTGAYRAVKVVHRQSFDHDRPFEREFEGILKFEPISRTDDSQVDILHVGRSDDCFYYVMELADDQATGGQINPDNYTPRTLKSDLLFHGRLSFEESVRIGVALTTALEHLHENGLVHRDVKPSNIIFVNGVPKLADIGLVTGVEATRSYVGTEGFAAPEGPGTPQGDLYSLGKVLYEAATGKDRQEFPELPTQLRELPDRDGLMELNAVIAKACRHDPKDRYRSAAAMRADLELLQGGKSLARLHRTEAQLRFVRRAGAVVTALAALIAAGWLWQARQTHVVSDLAAEKGRLMDTNREQIVRLRVANGSRLMDEGDLSGALLWFAEALPLVANRPAEEEIHRIRIQQVMNAAPRLLQVIEPAWVVSASAWSPDGRYVACATPRGLQLIDASTGKQLWNTPNPEPGRATELRFSRDGRRLMATLADSKCSVAAWAADSGRAIYRAVDDVVQGAWFSPDDRWLAIAETDFSIRILNAEDATFVLALKGHTGAVEKIAFSADGSVMASGSRDQTVRLWRLPSGESLHAPLVQHAPLYHVKLSDDGHRLLTATLGTEANPVGLVQLWDVDTGRPVGDPIRYTNSVDSLIATPGAVSSLVFSPGAGDHFLLEGGLIDVELWDTQPLKRVFAQSLTQTRGARAWNEAPYESEFRWVFSPDGERCVAGLTEGSLGLWVRGMDKLERSPSRHAGGVKTVRWSPDGQRLLTTSADFTAKIWSTVRETESARLELPLPFAGTPDWDMARRGRLPGPIPFWIKNGVAIFDPDRMQFETTLIPQVSKAGMQWYAACRSGRFWACAEGPEDGNAPCVVDLWEKQGTNFHCLQLAHPNGGLFMGFNADDSRLVTASCNERMVRIWRTADGQLERAIPLPPELHCIAFEPAIPNPNAWFLPDASAMLCLSGTNNELQLFDLATGQAAGKPFAVRAGVSRVGVFSPDGSRIGSLTVPGSAWVMDLKKGEQVAPPFQHSNFDLSDFDWSPDGKRVLTAGWGYPAEVKVWDASTGELALPPMLSGEKQARIARWSADGRFMVTRNNDQTARAWDASTGDPITPILRHTNYIRWCCITPGNRLITASEPNLLRAWDLKPTPLAADVIADYAKFLSGRRLSVGGVLLPIPAKELAELSRSLHARAPQLFE